MIQSDAEQLKSEEDVTHYHGQLLEQLRHVEDNCIVRNFWLDNRPELLRRLQANKISNEVLATTTFPRWVAIAILLAQFLPVLFLLLVAPFNEYMAYQEGG